MSKKKNNTSDKAIKKHIAKGWLRALLLACAISLVLIISSFVFLIKVTRHGERFTLGSFEGMTPQEALISSDSMKLRIEVIDSLYVESSEPGVIIDQYPKAGSFVKSNRRVTVTINTQAPKNVIIPYVTGYSLRQAKSTLSTAGVEVLDVSYIPDMATNSVLKQMYMGEEILPSSNKSVPVYSGVSLVVGLDEGAPTLYMPEVVGETLHRATERLQQEGLNIDVVSDDKNMTRSERLQAAVVRQYPMPRDSVGYGEAVKLYVTSDKTKADSLVSLFKSREKMIEKYTLELEVMESTMERLVLEAEDTTDLFMRDSVIMVIMETQLEMQQFTFSRDSINLLLRN